MKPFAWSESKNKWLQTSRNVSFEDILHAIVCGNVIADLPHPNQIKYPHQYVLIVNIKRYYYVVPYVEDEEKIFFKTIFPSRKIGNKFQKRKEHNEK